MYKVVKFDGADSIHMSVAAAIRKAVFVEEQGVDETLEWDGRDNEATHYLLFEENKAIGTARHRTTPEGVKLERFAVLHAYRNKGTGSILLAAVMNELPKEGVTIYLHAQEKAVSYYLRAGFKVHGEAFYEAGIRHFKMVLF